MSRAKPEIDFPGIEPPAELEIHDDIVGTGQQAAAGDTVAVHYVGVGFSSGEEFDSSYSRGTPLQFKLGVGMVIPGWDSGVQGMCVGGRRTLRIPSDLAYGAAGVPGKIAPGEALIFVCDLEAIA